MKYLYYMLTGIALYWICMQGMPMDLYRLFTRWDDLTVRHSSLTQLEIKLTRPFYRIVWCVNHGDELPDFGAMTQPLDLSGHVAEITAGLEDHDEKVRAIYGWIVDNIDYDLTYTVTAADECYRQRKGVCSAFADLLVKMLECAGIPAVKVSGEIKYRETGIYEESSHAWTLVENAKGEFIFTDVTWDACGRRDCDGPYRWKWFDLRPEEAIFTHRPYLTHHQRLERPLTREEFAELPYAGEGERCAGVDMTTYLKDCLTGTARPLPVMYMPGLFRIRSIPLTAVLKKGTRQTLTFTTCRPFVCAVMYNGTLVRTERSQRRDHRLVFTPNKAGKWSIVYRYALNHYSTLVDYEVK